MCCFSRMVTEVAGTRILARPLPGDRQLLVYEMMVDMPDDVAMVLPIPVPPDTFDDAVRFVDLSAAPGFFADVESLFPRLVDGPAPAAFGAPQSRAALPKLVVHDVGAFEASYVPRIADFSRLDSRFRLPSEVWDDLPRYADWGFCVFKLKKRRAEATGGLLGFFRRPRAIAGAQKFHPMAFDFPRRDPSVLYFPTVHVHDGRVHPTAHFDHELYCQVEPTWEPLLAWTRSSSVAGAIASPAREWLAPDAWLYKSVLKGELPNRDTYVSEAKLRARNVVGDSFRLRMKATLEHLVDDGKVQLDPQMKRWMRVSEAGRTRVRDAVAKDLAEFFTTDGAALPLATFRHDLPSEAFGGVGQTGSRLITFHAQTERMEPQELTVSFSSNPSVTARACVQKAFQDAMDRACVPPNLRTTNQGGA